MLPFTTDQFLGVFAAYNTAIWPLQVAAEVLGLAAAALLAWRPRGAGRTIAAILAAFWLLMGFGYQLAFFTAINPAAYAFAALFVAQGALFAVEAARRNRFEVKPVTGTWGAAAALLMAYALIPYPLVGLLTPTPIPRPRCSASPHARR